MKYFLLLLTIFLSLTSCSSPKKPKFEHIDNIVVKNVSLQNVTLNADVVFNNPNDLQGTLSIDDIHIFVDNIDMGTISSQKFNVPKKDRFSIPLESTISLAKIYNKNKKDILGSILKIVQTDSFQIQYKGIISYHWGDFSYPYTIDKKQMIEVK